jgi:hypothetical protein
MWRSLAAYPSGEHRGLGGTAALDGGLARPALGECGDVLGQPIDVEDMGIEVVREPFFEFAMALVVGIGDGLEESQGPPTSSAGSDPWL